MPSDGAHRESAGSSRRLDIQGGAESVLRINGAIQLGGAATVTNDGPASVQHAVFTPGSGYGAPATLAAGSSQAVALGVIRDFWPIGNQRASLRVSRP